MKSSSRTTALKIGVSVVVAFLAFCEFGGLSERASAAEVGEKWNSYADVVSDGFVMRPAFDASTVLPFGAMVYTVGRLKDSSEWMIMLERPSLDMHAHVPSVQALSKRLDDLSGIKISSVDLDSGSSVVAVSAIFYEPIDDEDPFVHTQIFLVSKTAAVRLFEKNVFAPPRLRVDASGTIYFEDVGPGCARKQKAREVRCLHKSVYRLAARKVR